MGEMETEVCTCGRENPLGPTGTFATLKAEKEGANVQGQRQHKRASGVGLQGPRGTLGSKLRVAIKKRAVTGGGGRREW